MEWMYEMEYPRKSRKVEYCRSAFPHESSTNSIGHETTCICNLQFCIIPSPRRLSVIHIDDMWHDAKLLAQKVNDGISVDVSQCVVCWADTGHFTEWLSPSHCLLSFVFKTVRNICDFMFVRMFILKHCGLCMFRGRIFKIHQQHHF